MYQYGGSLNHHVSAMEYYAIVTLVTFNLDSDKSVYAKFARCNDRQEAYIIVLRNERSREAVILPSYFSSQHILLKM